MHKTRDANRIARLIDRNVDDLYSDRKTHAEQSARNGILWKRAVALDVEKDVLTIFRTRTR